MWERIFIPIHDAAYCKRTANTHEAIVISSWMLSSASTEIRFIPTIWLKASDDRQKNISRQACSAR